MAGGTGSAKLLRGLSRLPVDLTVVANVGDNFWAYGAYVCPDVDIACYTLAGKADPRGWGLEGDTFEALGSFASLGLETWFRLGDRDLAVCMARTEMMRRGSSLTDATDRIRRSLGVRCRVLPVTDQPVETRLETPLGDLHLQEFWVRERGRPAVRKVRYEGAARAKVAGGVKKAIEGADRVIICPANPVTSVGPMTAVPGFIGLLSRTEARVVALSPMVGRRPVSGPAGKLLRATGVRPDSLGVAGAYSRFLDALLVSERDAPLKSSVEELGVKCALTDTLMRTPGDEARLARELVEA